jgi:hypothetical protein
VPIPFELPKNGASARCSATPFLLTTLVAVVKRKENYRDGTTTRPEELRVANTVEVRGQTLVVVNVERRDRSSMFWPTMTIPLITCSAPKRIRNACAGLRVCAQSSCPQALAQLGVQPLPRPVDAPPPPEPVVEGLPWREVVPWEQPPRAEPLLRVRRRRRHRGSVRKP